MRISDWSSDVCSSDLFGDQIALGGPARMQFLPALDRRRAGRVAVVDRPHHVFGAGLGHLPDQLVDVEFVDRLPLGLARAARRRGRSEAHTSELQSLMHISYAVFCLKKKKT